VHNLVPSRTNNARNPTMKNISPLLVAFLPLVYALPAADPVAENAHPEITARAILNERIPTPVNKRGLASITSDLGSKVSSYINSIESDVDNFLVGLPTGTAVLSSLGISDDDLAATPTQVLNIP
jgi:hypothetical protein